jgi:hypothetical protein
LGDRENDPADVSVNGGVTYCQGDPTDGSDVCGFDCAHAWNLDDPQSRDMNWLKAETERMRASIEALTQEEG